MPYPFALGWNIIKYVFDLNISMSMHSQKSTDFKFDFFHRRPFK